MTTYDGFAHLCRSLFLGKSDFMSMLTVYCDDSGTHKSTPAAVVAGYMSTVSQWEIFTKKWNGVLKEFGVTQMHRAALESWKEDFLEAKGWNVSSPKSETSQKENFLAH